MLQPRRGFRRFFALFGALALVLSIQTAAFADGTETLGPPSIPIAGGSGFASGGVGMELVASGSFDVVVPAGATVQQVLLYWEGFSLTNDAGDPTVSVNGNAVTGTLIGGPTRFFTQAFSTTYRADITGLGLVSPGTSTLTISDMNYSRNNNGAGAIVVYDDGTAADLQLRDGNDLAFINFDPTLDTTVPQTFGFAAEGVDRTATLTLFASSVTIDEVRPNSVEISIDGGPPIVIDTPFQSTQGAEFDVFIVDVTIPAGATSLTVQALSNDPSPSGEPRPDLPASFVWLGAGLSVPVTPPDGGGEGCTPGYWKQEHHFDSWLGYSPGDNFGTTFGVAPTTNWTLLTALQAKGGGEKALARHAVAALLNASSSVDYLYSAAEVTALVQGAYASGDFEGVKNLLESQNELGCPLN